jgi:hypothetical protein
MTSPPNIEPFHSHGVTHFRVDAIFDLSVPIVVRQ